MSRPKSDPTIVARELARLTKRIAELTGKRPRSRNVHHLSARLAEIEARMEAGEDVRIDSGAGSRVLSFSVSEQAGDALDEIEKRENVTRTALIRRALSEWAEANGYAKHAKLIRGDA